VSDDTKTPTYTEPRSDIEARAAFYASRASDTPLPQEMSGTAEEVVQRIRDRVNAASARKP
jgi:hypothetical protein